MRKFIYFLTILLFSFSLRGQSPGDLIWTYNTGG